MSAEAPRNSGTGEPISSQISSQRPKEGFSGLLRKLFGVSSKLSPTQQPIPNTQIGVQIREMEKRKMRSNQEYQRKRDEIERSNAEKAFDGFQRAREIVDSSGVVGLLYEARKALTPYNQKVSLIIPEDCNSVEEAIRRRFVGISSQQHISLIWSDSAQVRNGENYSVDVFGDAENSSLTITGHDVKILKDGEWRNREIVERVLIAAIKYSQQHFPEPRTD